MTLPAWRILLHCPYLLMTGIAQNSHSVLKAARVGQIRWLSLVKQRFPSPAEWYSTMYARPLFADEEVMIASDVVMEKDEEEG